MWWPLCLPGNAISLQSALGSEGRHGGCYSSKQFGSSCFRIQQRLYQFFSFLDFCGVLFCLVLPLTCVLLFFHPALLKKDPKNESVLQVRPWEDPENMVKSPGSEDRAPKFKSKLCSTCTRQSWVSFLPSPCLSFLTSKGRN